MFRRTELFFSAINMAFSPLSLSFSLCLSLLFLFVSSNSWVFNVLSGKATQCHL